MGLGSKVLSTTKISFVCISFVSGLCSLAGPKLGELVDLFLAGNLEVVGGGCSVEILNLGVVLKVEGRLEGLPEGCSVRV